MTARTDWSVFEDAASVHIVPNDDLREHELETTCWCRPTDDGGGISIHHSMDGREKIETGERRPS